MEKYNIGARELSIILELDEKIIERYLNGYVPTVENSKCLRKILNSSKDYYKMLMKNSNLISQSSFKKSQERCKELLEG